jgi:hypothetical protein
VDLEREPSTKRLDRAFAYEFSDLPLTVTCSAPGAGSVVLRIGTMFDGLTASHEVAAGDVLEVLDFRFENNTHDRVGFLIINRDQP